MTLGVRLTRLEANYARPPSIKLAKGDGDREKTKEAILGALSK